MKNIITIAGSDTLGGGGIQADLKTFEELDTFGIGIITCLANITNKNNFFIDALPTELIKHQLTSIMDNVDFDTVKLGLVNDISILNYLAELFHNSNYQIVTDPVLVFKEAETETNQEYLDTLINQILPISTVTTPNLKEAEILSGISIHTKKELQKAAEVIQNYGVPNVIIKGGSRFSGSKAVDYALLESEELFFEQDKLKSITVNGAGCTFSAAITAELAKNTPLPQAVELAKRLVFEGIKNGVLLENNLGNVWQGAYRNSKTRGVL